MNCISIECIGVLVCVHTMASCCIVSVQRACVRGTKGGVLRALVSWHASIGVGVLPTYCTDTSHWLLFYLS